MRAAAHLLASGATRQAAAREFGVNERTIKGRQG
jgi:transposase-like protein